MKKTKKKQPLILLDTMRYVPELHGVLEEIVKLAKEREWRFMNLHQTGGNLLDGIILDGAIINSAPDSPLARHLLSVNCPVVRVGINSHSEDHLVPAILADLQVAGEQAATHFFERNFKDVGYVRHEPWGMTRRMLESFESKAGELGLASHSLVMIPRPAGSKLIDRFHAKLHSQVVEWLESIPKPVGVLCYSDGMAGSLSLTCELLGLEVPEEIALLSYGNTVECETAPVQLSSIVPDAPKVAELAVNSLNALLAGREVPPQTFVPPKGIVERHSTNVLAVPDPVVAKAIRYLWDNLEFPITVEDVVRDMNVSRRTIERGFRKCLGRGIKVELQRKRLEQFTELLLMSDMTIPEIAERTGFTNLGHLHKLFKMQHGMPPRQYREGLSNKCGAQRHKVTKT